MIKKLAFGLFLFATIGLTLLSCIILDGWAASITALVDPLCLLNGCLFLTMLTIVGLGTVAFAKVNLVGVLGWVRPLFVVSDTIATTTKRLCCQVSEFCYNQLY